MSGGGERLRAAAERYPNPSTDWRILVKPLSEAFGFGRSYGTGTALAKNAALLGIADLLRDLESKRRLGNAMLATTYNFFYVTSLRFIQYVKHLEFTAVNCQRFFYKIDSFNLDL